MTMTVITVPLPRNFDATRITNSIGRLSITSTRRISKLSTMPPAKPAMAPTIVPMNTPIAMLENPISSEVRAPLTTSVNTSRWRPPVSPIGRPSAGGRPAATISSGIGMSVKLNGSRNGPMTATPNRNAIMPRPISASRCLRNLRHASCHWLSDLSPTS